MRARNFKMRGRCCAVSILLLLAVTSARGEVNSPTPSMILSQCVQACECYQESRQRAANLVVKCRDVSDIPTILPAGTTSLEIKDARVPSLRAQLQQHSLRRLKDLDLSGCAVEEVALDAFHGLPKLRFVSLANNSIAALSAAHFDKQRHLSLVEVSGNADLDCTAFRREMMANRPRACVKCDGDDEPCDFTAGSSTAVFPELSGDGEIEETSRKAINELNDDELLREPDDYLEISELPSDMDDVVDDDVEVVQLKRDWSYMDGEGRNMTPSMDIDGSVFGLITVAGALGGALGACLVFVAVTVVRKLREETQDPEKEHSQKKPLVPCSSSSSIYSPTTTPTRKTGHGLAQ